MPGNGRTWLAVLRERRLIDTLDAEFAGLLARLHPETTEEALAAAALVSRALREGHTCLPLARIAGQLARMGRPTDAKTLRDMLAASGAVGVDGDTARPLVLTAHGDGDGALTLYRWHQAEARIARDLQRRGEGFCDVDAMTARPLLDQLFPPAPDGAAEPDLQRAAAALALIKRLVILCGGPGTGKTYTLARMLALFAALHPSGTPPRIALAAPTGRAAKRLGESIRAAAAELPPAFRLADPPEPQTLHRLLGFRTDGGFARDRKRPLALDLLVVDEASMLDTRLLDALLAALPADAKLALSGDPGQLPPVEPGGLLHALGPRRPAWSTELRARLSAFGSALPPENVGNARATLADCRVTLRQARRFGAESGIFALAHALEAKEPASALAPLLARFKTPGADVDIPEPGAAAEARLTAFLREMLESLRAAATPAEALTVFTRRRVLCALREGRFGEAGLNARCRELLRRIDPGAVRREPYRGLPLLILENDYGNRLFNGEVGVVWPDEQGELMAWFEEGGGLRALPPAALPRRQPAYAMTVHKAQGGEFDHVLLILPDAGPDAEDVPLLARELLYTAVTRAKSRLTLIAPPEQLLVAASRRLVRHGNVGPMLGVPNPNSSADA